MTDQKYEGTLHINALFEFELDGTSEEDKKRLERIIRDYLEPKSYNAGGLQPDGCLDIDCESPNVDLQTTLRDVEVMKVLCKSIVPDLNVDSFGIWLSVEEYYPEDEAIPCITTSAEHPQGIPSTTRHETFEYNVEGNFFWQHPTPATKAKDMGNLIKLEVDQIKFV